MRKLHHFVLAAALVASLAPRAAQAMNDESAYKRCRGLLMGTEGAMDLLKSTKWQRVELATPEEINQAESLHGPDIQLLRELTAADINGLMECLSNLPQGLTDRKVRIHLRLSHELPAASEEFSYLKPRKVELALVVEIRGWRDGQFVSQILEPSELEGISMSRFTVRYLTVLGVYVNAWILSKDLKTEATYRHGVIGMAEAMAVLSGDERSAWVPTNHRLYFTAEARLPESTMGKEKLAVTGGQEFQLQGGSEAASAVVDQVALDRFHAELDDVADMDRFIREMDHKPMASRATALANYRKILLIQITEMNQGGAADGHIKQRNRLERELNLLDRVEGLPGSP